MECGVCTWLIRGGGVWRVVIFPTSRWSFAVVACSASIAVDFSWYFGEPSCGRCSGLWLEPSMFDRPCLCGVLSGCRDRNLVVQFIFFWCSATVTRKLDNSRVQREREREITCAVTLFLLSSLTLLVRNFVTNLPWFNVLHIIVGHHIILKNREIHVSVQRNTFHNLSSA